MRLRPHPRFRVEGRDLYVDLPVAPWEAALGATVEVPTLDGTTRVKVPPGSSTGRSCACAARACRAARRHGDLYAIVKIEVPKQPTDEERELFERLAEVSNFNPREEAVMAPRQRRQGHREARAAPPRATAGARSRSRSSPARPACIPSSCAGCVRLGLVEPAGGTARAPLFPRDAAARLARAMRLRRDLGLNYAGAVLACELLARIDELEERLRRYEPRRTATR